MKHDIIKRIIGKLYDYEDTTEYGCDLAYTLFEGENIDGSFTYNAHEAKEWIKDNYDDISEVYEELIANFGTDYLKDFNMFDNPEKFMVLIILEAANYILGRCPLIEEFWNDQLTLTKENIKTLEKQLNDLDDGGAIYG